MLCILFALSRRKMFTFFFFDIHITGAFNFYILLPISVWTLRGGSSVKYFFFSFFKLRCGLGSWQEPTELCPCIQKEEHMRIVSLFAVVIAQKEDWHIQLQDNILPIVLEDD